MKYIFLFTILLLSVTQCSATCDTVRNLSVSHGVVDSFTIYATWDNDTNAMAYQAYVGGQNSTPKNSGSSYLTSDSMVLNAASPDSTYTICVRAICGTGDTSSWICRSIKMPSMPPTGISGYSLRNSSVVYPNPATDNISFYLPASITSAYISIRDIRGQTLLHNTIKNNGSVNIATLPGGLYIVTIQSDQYLKMEKLIKQ